MIRTVIHTADIHIPKLKRQDEYAEQLTRFIEKCKEVAAPYKREEVRIVISGDLFESKNAINNELIVFASTFLRQLQEIATVIVISGNHDLVLSNLDRTDTMTALFNTAAFANCKFLDAMLGYESGCVVDDTIIWAVYSIYDDYARPSIEEAIAENGEPKKVVGLYHGMVVGAKLDNGTVTDMGLGPDIFEGCDCVMAGHIHKRQAIKRGNVEIVYPSSLIQQTFGETVSQHGFEVWDMETMQHHFVGLESDYGLYRMEISSFDDIDNDKEKLTNI